MTDKERIEQLEKQLQEHTQKKSWFSKLPIWAKVLASIVTIGVSLSAISSGVVGFIELVFHEEIHDYELLQKQVKLNTTADSLMLNTILTHTHEIDTLKNEQRAGSSYYAVGFRAEKLADGTIKKYYRGWDSEIHQIYPDPYYSTESYTYYFYNLPNGTKQYCFTK